MNLKKYGAKKKVKPSNFHFKNKKTQEFTKNNEFLCFYIRAKNRVFSQTLILFIYNFTVFICLV
jgi:hypothetical protein